jgi:hypothetical protein
LKLIIRKIKLENLPKLSPYLASELTLWSLRNSSPSFKRFSKTFSISTTMMHLMHWSMKLTSNIKDLNYKQNNGQMIMNGVDWLITFKHLFKYFVRNITNCFYLFFLKLDIYLFTNIFWKLLVIFFLLI